MKKTILLDLDDTLNNLVHVWLSIYNMEYNVNVKYEEIKSWDLTQWVPHPDIIYKYVKEPGIYKHLCPIKDSQDVVSLICKKYNVHVATYYPTPESCSEKYEFIQTYYPSIDKDNIHFTRKKTMINADIIIDDNPDYVQRFRGELGILVNQPWNQELKEIPSKIIRTCDWETIGSILL
jgi:5'(3')-deoxyribonucleotidase